ncbi:MAG: lycopene cyclase domain-containing protein [Arthrobacter sp.]|nr:lycopene cyclase domain-containing protein [Arthrobacter sp.]
MSYLALDAVFLVVCCAVTAGVARATRRRGGRRADAQVSWPAVAVAGVVLLALTAVFDNVMIAVGLFSYDPASLSGAHLGNVPVEDFAYPVAAALMLPVLWVLLRGRERQGGHDTDR